MNGNFSSVARNYSNWTENCVYLDYRTWYPICAWTFQTISLYMLIVSILYYMEFIKSEGGRTRAHATETTRHSVDGTVRKQNETPNRTLKNFNKIVIAIWVFINMSLLSSVIRHLIGVNILCAHLSIFYLIQTLFTFLGFTTIYACLWYRCYKVFAGSNIPIEKVKRFQILSLCIVVFFLLLSLPTTGLFIARSDYRYLLRKTNNMRTSSDERIYLASVILYGIYTTTFQILFLVLFSYPIESYKKQMKQCPNQEKTLKRLISLLQKLRLITVLCVISDWLVAGMNLIPSRIIGTETELLLSVDIATNGLFLIFSFKDPWARLGLSWVCKAVPSRSPKKDPMSSVINTI